MTFPAIWFQLLLLIAGFMTILWITSIFAFFSLAAGSWIPVLGSLLMTALIIKVSGVALLEKSLVTKKPGYGEYVRKTSAFIPWFPGK